MSFYECFRMICAFDHGSLVKDVVNKMKANNIDEKYRSPTSDRFPRTHVRSPRRKLVQYCVLKGYLRRVRDYRVSLDESAYISSSNVLPLGNADGADSAKMKLKKTLRELCDGTNDSDSLACSGYSKSSSCMPTRTLACTLPL